MLKRLEAMASLFVRITAGILFVSATYISVFYGWKEALYVKILWQILALALVCTLGSLVLPVDDEREISRKSMLIRMVLYYIYVNIVVLFSGFFFGWFSFGNLKQVLGMVAAIAFVYLAVGALSFWMGYREAERMNRKLGGRNIGKNQDKA